MNVPRSSSPRWGSNPHSPVSRSRCKCDQLPHSGAHITPMASKDCPSMSVKLRGTCLPLCGWPLTVEYMPERYRSAVADGKSSQVYSCAGEVPFSSTMFRTKAKNHSTTLSTPCCSTYFQSGKNKAHDACTDEPVSVVSGRLEHESRMLTQYCVIVVVVVVGLETPAICMASMVV